MQISVTGSGGGLHRRDTPSCCPGADPPELDSIRHEQSRAVKVYRNGNTPIALLLKSRCPAAVFLAVWAVVVDPIYGVYRRWPWPNVSYERTEVSVPWRLNRYAPAPVITEGLVLAIDTPRFHRGPNSVFGGQPAIPSAAMFNVHGLLKADMRHAAATLGNSGSKQLRPDNLLHPTGTAAQPIRTRLASEGEPTRPRQHRQVPKGLAR
jgi:hypothetical protein